MQPQPLTDTFIEAVRYIYYNRRQLERVEIDKHLLSRALHPYEIDRAWHAVENKAGWAILQDAKRAANKQAMSPVDQFVSKGLSGCFLLCLKLFLAIGTLIGWVCIEIWLDKRIYLPLFLVLPLVFGGIFVSYLMLDRTDKTYATPTPNRGWGVLFIFGQFVVFVAAFLTIMGSPGPLPAFSQYPDSTTLPIPAHTERMDSSITLECESDIMNEHSNFFLTAKEAFYTNASTEKIREFYKEQAATKGRDGLKISGGWNGNVAGIKLLTDPGATNQDSAVCYKGEMWRFYLPVNAIIILHVSEHKGALTTLFPELPSDTENVVFIFNEVLSVNYI